MFNRTSTFVGWFDHLNRFVIMASFRDAQAAIENLDQFVIQDCKLHVKVSLSKEEKEKRKKRKEVI